MSRLLPLGVALAAFALYVSGVASTLTYGGDCGELIAASYRLGIAHPTGYPLYCLLGRVFASLLPLGEVAWRYNVLSALFGAAAIGLVTASVYRLTAAVATDATNGDAVNTDAMVAEPPDDPSAARNIWPALGAGLLLAGFYPFWTQSVIAEVYALNALMLSALLFCAVAWHQSGDWRWAYSLAVAFGLALNAHLSCVFMAPGLLLYAVVQHRARFEQAEEENTGNGKRETQNTAVPVSRFPFPVSPMALRRLGGMLLIMLAAYALTLYLPMRARALSRTAFKRTAFKRTAFEPRLVAARLDTSRRPGTLVCAHISAKQYKSLLIAAPASLLPGRLATLLGFVFLAYLWFTPLFLVGAVRAWRGAAPSHLRRTGGHCLGAMLLLTFALNVGIEINYNVGDQMNFFFPAYIVMAVWMGLGLSWLWRAADGWAARLDAGRSTRPTRENRAAKSQPPAALWRWRVRTLLQLLLLATVAVQWSLAAPIVSWRGQTAARDTALEHAAAAEQLAARSGQTPSLLLLSDDALWAFWYAKYVLRRAPDTRTPWGRNRNAAATQKRLADYVSDLQRRGPVALSVWDEGVDRRFPYTLLTPGGSLCLASHRVLPPPATPLSSSATGDSRMAHDDPSGTRDARRGSNILRAGFRLRQVSRNASLSMTAPVRVAELKRDNMAAFEMDFRVPWTTPLSPQAANSPTLDRASRPPAMHIGWIEVLLTPAEPGNAGHFAGAPPPEQDTIIKSASGAITNGASVGGAKDDAAPATSFAPNATIKNNALPDVSVLGEETAPVEKAAVIAWKQTRRLVVPQRVRAGEVLRAVVSLQMESGATLGRYNVWLRLVRSPRDTTTSWRRLSDIQLTRD